MLYTSSYKNFNSKLYKGVSISKDKGKDANWKKDYYLSLAPTKELFKTWKKNKGIISDEENNLFYITEFYKQVLSKLDITKTYNELSNCYLLCYENNDEFCHRHIVAAWFELFLDVKIKEVVVDGLSIVEVERPEWIKDTLEKVIKENINMRGFKSLRALFLFDTGEQYEKEANEKEKTSNKNYDYLRQAACYMRCEADRAEEEYNESIKVKKLTKNE